MRYLFNTIFYTPLYNALVWLSAILPGHSLGLAIILLTILVRIILFPFQHKMSHTQRKMRELESTIKDIKEKHAKDNAEQARQIMQLYKEHGVNPFAGFVVLIIQLPILLALYWVTQAKFDPSLLYSFVQAPAFLNTSLFGLDITAHSYIVAIIVGLSQFAQISLSLPATPTVAAGQTRSLKDDMARSMNIQMRYILPIFIVLVSARLPAAVSLYWITSNLFSIGHELYVRRQSKSLQLNSATTN